MDSLAVLTLNAIFDAVNKICIHNKRRYGSVPKTVSDFLDAVLPYEFVAISYLPTSGPGFRKRIFIRFDEMERQTLGRSNPGSGPGSLDAFNPLPLAYEVVLGEIEFIRERIQEELASDRYTHGPGLHPSIATEYSRALDVLMSRSISDSCDVEKVLYLLFLNEVCQDKERVYNRIRAHGLESFFLPDTHYKQFVRTILHGDVAEIVTAYAGYELETVLERIARKTG